TKSHDQGWVSSPEAGSWSWFDIVVLDSPEAEETKARDGLSLVWLNHINSLSEKEYKTECGHIFEGDHDIFGCLEAIISSCCLYSKYCWLTPTPEGWKRARCPRLYALSGVGEPRLRSSLDTQSVPGPRGGHNLPDEQKAYLEEVKKQITSLKETVDTYLSDTMPEDAPSAYSSVAKMIPLQGPVSADQLAATKQPPLRLLSFGTSSNISTRRRVSSVAPRIHLGRL
ncbi:hypothetical protein DXG01_012532, partial [Tephrocybe rancida]